MVTTGPDTRAQTVRDSELDDAWRGLVAEAAAAAGIEQERARAERRARADATRVGIVRPRAVSAAGERAERRAERVELEVVRGSRSPDAAVPADLEGALVSTSRARAVSADVDLDAREIAVTCQIGRFRVHEEATSSFPAAHFGGFGSYNVARAGITAEVAAARLAEVGPIQVVAGVCVPVSHDNPLQRVWRLAVPSRDMLRSDDRAHMAVAGVRGRIDLTVEGAGDPLRCSREFMNRSLSAHAYDEPTGFGPIKGMHVLEIDLGEIDPGPDLAVRVEVTLLSMLAGTPEDYVPGAPFFAGVDFGGGGSVGLPSECLSSFEIPLTPLIGNEPITVAHLGFVHVG